jgi:hypothetical protein
MQAAGSARLWPIAEVAILSGHKQWYVDFIASSGNDFSFPQSAGSAHGIPASIR